MTDDPRGPGYLRALLVNPWRTAGRLIVLAFGDDPDRDAAARWFALGDEYESIEADVRAARPDPRGRSHFQITAPRTSPLYAKIFAVAAAVWHWITTVFLPWLWCATKRVAGVVARVAVALYGVFRDQLKATDTTKGVANGADIKRAAATAATSTSVFSLCAVLGIVALHGAAGLVSVLPLGVPGDILLFVIHFFLQLAVRVNHGNDPLAPPSALEPPSA